MDIPIWHIIPVLPIVHVFKKRRIIRKSAKEQYEIICKKFKKINVIIIIFFYLNSNLLKRLTYWLKRKHSEATRKLLFIFIKTTRLNFKIIIF